MAFLSTAAVRNPQRASQRGWGCRAPSLLIHGGAALGWERPRAMGRSLLSPPVAVCLCSLISIPLCQDCFAPSPVLRDRAGWSTRRTAGSQGQQGCPCWSTEERGRMPLVPHLCLFPLLSPSFPRGGDALLCPAAAMRGPAAASGLVGTSRRRAGMSREDTTWGVLCWAAPRESCKTLGRVLETQRRKQRLKKPTISSGPQLNSGSSQWALKTVHKGLTLPKAPLLACGPLCPP